MTRKEELVIIIDRLREKIYDKYDNVRDDYFCEFFKKYTEIKNLQDELEVYMTEYKSVK